MANMEYINSLSVVDLRIQLAYALDLNNAFVMTFRKYPAMPPPSILKHIVGTFPDDWERGKVIQRAMPLGFVPFKTECEIGAGMWDRITNGKWADHVKPDTK